MSISTIIVLNVALAATLTAILAAVMLAPSRLRQPFAAGHTHRQRLALRRELRLARSQRQPGRYDGRGLRAISEQ
ncbi:MAG: hypothetical protein JST31_05615 [Actinobacteria bacterium]|nr:hypothetical protein [Actinomycetota bacterium]